MFGTLHTGNEGEEPAFITHHIRRRAEDGNVRIHKYTACDGCRAKKLRCSSQRSGCTRCKAASIECVYSDSNIGRGRKRKSTVTVDPSSLGDMHGTTSWQNSNSGPNSSTPLSRHPRGNDLGAELPVEQEHQSTDPSGLPTPNGHDLASQYFIDLNLNEFSLGLDTGSLELDPFDGFQHDDLFRDGVTHSDYIADTITQPTSQNSSPTSTGQALAYGGYSNSSWLPQTPATLPTPPSTSHSSRGSISSAAACRNGNCPRKAVELLEEVRSTTYSLNETSLHGTLAFHKTALSQCSALLECALCPHRAENILLLALLGQELALQSEKMTKASRDAVCSGNGGTGESQAATLFGSYTIDTPEEGEAIMRTLLYVNLKSLMNLIMRLKNMASPEDVHYTIITKTEKKVSELSREVNKI